MKIQFKTHRLIVVAETEEDRFDLQLWQEGREETLFGLSGQSDSGLCLHALGPRDEVCREPINVTSMVADPAIAIISNFAAAPFELDGRPFATVESFWQGLKFADKSERRRVAALDGKAAKRAGEAVDYGATVEYDGRSVIVGTWDHWQLMRAACWAKFSQFIPAREALLATGERPLVHIMRHDSHTIPAVVMAEIWMKVRESLRREA